MRCPVCKAELGELVPQCRRCRADLSLLVALEEQRCRLLAQAARCVSKGSWRQAEGLATSADALRPNEDSRLLLAVLALLRRDFASAWHYYERLCRAEGEGN